ncbi:synaptotagmin-7-like [Hydractinia symbiolongicarpus]|uniref:synaptotagmin-7-like n=1 Tax=Hydractinia symbiolongicarpus TaxID=13093 RepID=UPI00254B795D|nr:synaptotagmin-7-like [Hydractinia symbiolongicarpus]
MVVQNKIQDSIFGHAIAVAACSFVALISFVIVCAWCFKKKSKRLPSIDECDDVGSQYNYDKFSKSPLLRNGSPNIREDNFPFLGKVSDLNRSRASTSLGVPSMEKQKVSPGWGPKSITFGSPAGDTSFESMSIQPKNKDLSTSCDSLVSSLSSIPAEPEVPTDRGEDLGSIYFSISYDVYDLVLKLTIQKAVNLPAKDLSGTSDPFVKVLLLPDKKNKLETRVKRKRLNPVWNEVFTFEGFPHQKLVQRTLYLQVLDYDRFSRNDPIGEIELPLADVHLQSEPVPFVKKLNPCKRSADYLGDLLISMCYNPTSSCITIVVMKCTNLKVMDITGSCDPYVKIYLVYSGKRIDKKKTSIKRRALNPVWNESFEFEVPIDKIREISFVLTVIDFDRILPNEAIGQVIIGYRTAGTSLKHWTEMMNHPRKPIAMWHKIIKY